MLIAYYIQEQIIMDFPGENPQRPRAGSKRNSGGSYPGESSSRPGSQRTSRGSPLEDIINRLSIEVNSLREEREAQRDELRSLKGTVHSLEVTITSLDEQLDVTKRLFAECSRDLRAAKAEDSLADEVPKLDLKISELQAAAEEEHEIKKAGHEVRLRFLENHRRYNMNRKPPTDTVDRIKAGNRAAHRGRPVADALLCVHGDFRDAAVYKDLYGVPPEDMAPRDIRGKHRGKGWCEIQDMVTVTSFRASLKSEKALTRDFEDLFNKILEETTRYDTADALGRALKEDKRLNVLQDKLHECFDKTVEKNKLQKRIS